MATMAKMDARRLDLNTLEVTCHFRDGALVLLERAGRATIFGAPVQWNVSYKFKDTSITIVCKNLCRFDIIGDFECKPPTSIHCGLDRLHSLFDVKREHAGLHSATTADGGRGPVILVAGDKDTGKSTTCRTLANLAVSSSGGGLPRGVAVVDLDVGQGSIAVPAAIATAFIEAPIPIDEGFATMVPLSFFFGSKVVNERTRKRYLDICAYTHQSILSVQSSKEEYRRGGVVINTMGWVRELGYDLIKQIIQIFEVTDVVITGGAEELWSNLKSDFKYVDETLKFHLVEQKPNVIVKRDGLDRVASRSQQLETYFKGTLRTPLAPTRLVVFLKDVVLLDAETFEDVSARQVKPLTLAAVSTAANRELCPSANVAGFVIVTDVGRETLTLLAPAPGKLPRPFLLLSNAVSATTESIPSFGS